MVAPIKYRSVFTGQEIDEAIATMRASSLGIGLLVNDFSGGVSKIASAELAKILKTTVDANDEPAHIKAQLMSIPNAKVLSDVEYNRVVNLGNTVAFRGSFANADARATATNTESVGYIGGEITFIADDGSHDHLPEFSTWDWNNSVWRKVQLYNEGGTFPVVVATASATNLFNFKANRYSAIKVLIVSSNGNGTQKQVQEALITHIGTDTYISVYNEVGNANLISLSSVYNKDINNLLTIVAQDFTHVSWNPTGIAPSGAAGLAPDGSLTANSLLETATNNAHTLAFGLNSLGSVTLQRRFSIYAKANGRTTMRGWSTGTGDQTAQLFDLTGAGTATGSLSPTIAAVGGGWYRCSWLVPADQAGNVVFGPTDGAVSDTNLYSGNASQGILVWGAMLNTTGVLGDYVVPTVSVVVTTLAANVNVAGKVIAMI